MKLFFVKSYNNTLLSGVKDTVTSRLKNVNSSDDNMKEASKLGRIFWKEKRSRQMLIELLKYGKKSLIITMAVDEVLFYISVAKYHKRLR